MVQATRERTDDTFRFNPFAGDYLADPYPTFRYMRENHRVYKYRTLSDDEWVLTRYEDIRQVLTDKRFLVQKLGDRVAQKIPFMPRDSETMRALSQNIGSWLFFVDPPDHTRMRHVVSRDFTASAVNRVRPTIEAFVDAAFDRLRRDGGMDLMAVLARPLPAVVAAALLGLHTDRMHELIECSEHLFSIFEQPISFDGYRRMADASARFSAFFEEEFARRAGRPPENDLLGKLLATCGNEITTAELISFSAMLFAVGQETTENYIGNSVHALLSHPDQFALLRAEPGLIPKAALELARYDSAVQFVVRIPTEDITIGDATLRRGDLVYMALGAANRDPGEFEAPDRLDLKRTETSNLPFGSGIHFCLGSALARLQVEIVLERLVRWPHLRIDTSRLERRRTILLRGLRSMHVHVAPHDAGAAA